MIPPFCYARRRLAQAVNVDATARLVQAASALPNPPRFVQASSIAVYGARNPFRTHELLTASTPVRPTELYGAQKALAERTVTASDLDWVVLRLGGVLTAEPRWTIDRDLIFFEAYCPPTDAFTPSTCVMSPRHSPQRPSPIMSARYFSSAATTPIASRKPAWDRR